jgi:nitroreductase
MTIDVQAVDEALTTTRAVRLRLDLERPVDDQILLDCIDVAEQAPSGGNQGSRRWIIVRDQSLKDRLAELYMDSAGAWMVETRDRLAGSGHPQERVMASAAHLAEHLAEVPAIVIPTIIGVYDGEGGPGLFDSVIQSVWSFCVALRARGLGSAWTTAILSRRDEIADVLGIPDGMTQIAMLPVAWTKGTEFRRAPRYPARSITYFDGFSRTWEQGPSVPHRLGDGPGTVVEADIKAPPAVVWPYVTDIGFSARFSTELDSARWTHGAEGPRLGAEFIGSSTHPAVGEWQTRCFVDRYEEHREFGWVTADRDQPGARWRFELSSIAGATRLRHSVVLGPGRSRLAEAIERDPEAEPDILARRIDEHRRNMRLVVTGIKATAERDSATASGSPDLEDRPG